MAVTLPAPLEPAFALLGVAWPGEDEDRLRECAGAYRAMAAALRTQVLPVADGAVTFAATDNAGQHIDALHGYWAGYSGTGPQQPGHLPALAAAMTAMAEGHDLAATLFEIGKTLLVFASSYVLLALTWAGAAAVVSGGLAVIRARAMVEAARRFAHRVMTALRRRFTTFFTSRLVRGVESVLRRVLLASRPALPSLATLGRVTRLGGAAASAAFSPLDAPRKHPPAPDSPAGTRWSGEYRIGPPQTPEVRYDHGFPYDPDAKPTPGDYASWYKWQAKQSTADLFRPDLEDGLAAYEHYLDGSGTDFEIDYEKAYKEDPGVAGSVEQAITNAQAEAERLHRQTGSSSFSMTGQPMRGNATTENWQKAIGAHAIWGSGQVTVQGGQATMELALHAEDRYNFNRGSHDAKTGTPDDENGRFETLGWATSFRTHGSLRRTVTWTIPG
ncbi:hypothetical protein [Nonomuraea dietziae]|uniref:hypothetical protein n=1 Tax=Nonomuraea dietziae TaxID=65515 RepID=UPI0033C2E643